MTEKKEKNLKNPERKPGNVLIKGNPCELKSKLQCQKKEYNARKRLEIRQNPERRTKKVS